MRRAEEVPNLGAEVGGGLAAAIGGRAREPVLAVPREDVVELALVQLPLHRRQEARPRPRERPVEAVLREGLFKSRLLKGGS